MRNPGRRRLLGALLLALLLLLSACSSLVEGTEGGFLSSEEGELVLLTEAPAEAAQKAGAVQAADPEETKAPKVTKTPKATKAPKATATPKATKAPKVTATPKATKAPKVTKAPQEANAPPEKAGPLTEPQDIADYLFAHGKLPDNFLTKQEARALGWTGGDLSKVAPGMSIGGDRFGNYEGRLPQVRGRKYYEADCYYTGGPRNAYRIIYSNDGHVWYTEDHYETFTEMSPSSADP